jgi:3-deoxy-7-phosphoheptulonate synthase
MKNLQDLNIEEIKPLLSPKELKTEMPITEKATDVVYTARKEVQKILAKEDSRLLLIVGPCSVHNPEAALEYAKKLKVLKDQVQDKILIIMRVYFEKPRTTIGWKGLINDPHLNGSTDIQIGLKKARKLLLDVNELGMPAATEFLDPIVPQYISGLVSWAAIGARTTESQTHREMASGLSMPVGFKNGTDGNLQICIDAMESAKSPHSFLGIDLEGKCCVVKTQGNPWGHAVLRGGKGQPNYEPKFIAEAKERLQKAGLDPALLVDCSHANSGKQHTKQEEVWNSIMKQRAAGESSIIGMMVESNLFEGNQPLKDPKDLQYGVSITDACMSWDATEKMVLDRYNSI